MRWLGEKISNLGLYLLVLGAMLQSKSITVTRDDGDKKYLFPDGKIL